CLRGDAIWESVVEAPLRRVEERQRLVGRGEGGLDALPVAAQVRERDARVLVELAEQALAVDRVQWSLVEGWGRESEPLALVCLVVDHPADHLLGRAAVSVDEALTDAALGSWPGDG